MKKRSDTTFQLPTNEEDYMTMIRKLVKDYKLPDIDHAAGLVSVAIRHLPSDQARVSYRYLADCVIKNLANYTANHVGEKLKSEVQIKQLIDLVEKNPNDFQSRDMLQKASDEGWTSAKAALEKLAGPTEARPTPLTLVDNNASSNGTTS